MREQPNSAAAAAQVIPGRSREELYTALDEEVPLVPLVPLGTKPTLSLGLARIAYYCEYLLGASRAKALAAALPCNA